MRFEVPAGSALVFSGQDGRLLAEPVTRPVVRIVQSPSSTAPSAPEPPR
jgi:hypothetical protein